MPEVTEKHKKRKNEEILETEEKIDQKTLIFTGQQFRKTKIKIIDIL